MAHPPSLALLLVLLVGCIGEKVDTGPFDSDSDGSVAAYDCDDADPAVYPGATEICDGIDNDCDGLVDAYAVDMGHFYVDADGDGFGDETYEVSACTVPDGYSTAGGDCDDGDPAVFPGAIEICDGLDNDCNGLADEADPGLDQGTASAWYPDADGDGYGAKGSSETLACEDPSGATLAYSENHKDCDDTNASVNPGLNEICGDGLDNDCDGTDNGCTPTGDQALADVGARLLGEGAGDEAGIAVAGAGDVDGDGYDDVWVGSLAGAYLVRGPVVGTVGLSLADAAIRATDPTDALGTAVAGQDLDGDGYSDLLLGAPGEGGGAGAVRVFYGPLRGDLGADAADAVWTGSADAPMGSALAALGGSEAAFGVPEALVEGALVGMAWWVADAGAGGTAADASGALIGEAGWESLGVSVAGPGDVNGDGVDDRLFGAPAVGEGLGAAALVLGPADGARLVSAADALWMGSDVGGALGAAVAFLGDNNGDGYGDLLIGAPGGDGAVFVLAGGAAVDPSLADALAVLAGPTGSGAGASVAGAGDPNGDGYADALIGAPADGDGVAWAVLGPVSGTVSLDAAWRILVGAGGEAAGYAVASAGDEDGDGRSDLLIGAPLNGGDGESAGAAWVVSGDGW